MKVTLIFPHVAHATLGDMGYIPKLFAKKTKEGRYSSHGCRGGLAQRA